MKLALLKKAVLVALACLSCTSCICHRPECARADELIQKNDQLLIKEGYTPAYFSGSYHNTIRHVSKGYITKEHQFATLPTARFFIVEQMEAFAKPFNEEKALHIYLQDYPFSAKNISLQFHFLDQESRPLLYPNFAQINSMQGQVTYYYWDEVTNNPRLAFSERYDQALNSYNKSKLANWKPKLKPTPKIQQ